MIERWVRVFKIFSKILLCRFFVTLTRKEICCKDQMNVSKYGNWFHKYLSKLLSSYVSTLFILLDSNIHDVILNNAQSIFANNSFSSIFISDIDWFHLRIVNFSSKTGELSQIWGEKFFLNWISSTHELEIFGHYTST